MVLPEEIENAKNLQHLEKSAIDIQIFTQPKEWPIHSTGLVSDLARHTGFIGRVTITGNTSEEVTHLLQLCAPQRALTSDQFLQIH